MNEFVLDASALLAYLQQEPGWQRVESLIAHERCHLLSVNLTEVLSRLADWNVPVAELKQRIDGFDLELDVFDESLAVAAAQMRSPTRSLGLSLGDRACLALAKKLDAMTITADRPWLNLDPALGIRVECIRPDTR